MSGALWGVQIALSGLFLIVGAMKLLRSKKRLAPKMVWVEDHSQEALRAIGAAEVSGAAGLLLPGLLDTLPWATPLAALGLAVLMLGATWTHVRRKEHFHMLVPLVFALLSGSVAYARFVEL